ncbi:hypothetical protein B5S33_g2526 [[Candida] boidinii]|nr:hypothetical protein B5S30_g1958 [[Candida] boidinii]OWB83891.1 hypothetical protein B5S33_g2526 [[Candida] boidinii]GMF97964.1 unnamed protein product [[Candida] boidinii]
MIACQSTRVLRQKSGNFCGSHIRACFNATSVPLFKVEKRLLSSVTNNSSTPNTNKSGIVPKGASIKDHVELCYQKFKAVSSIGKKLQALEDIIPELNSNDLISNKETATFIPSTIRIGIISSPTVTRGNMLDAIINDPLEIDQSGFQLLKENRLKSNRTNIIKYLTTPVFQPADPDTDVYWLPSPILNKDTRVIQHKDVGINSQDTQSFGLNKDFFNDIEFIEIYDKNNSKIIESSNNEDLQNKNQDVEEIIMNPLIQKDKILKNCHLYIFVKSSIGEKLPIEYQDWPVLEIVDHELDLAFDSEQTPMVIDFAKVNEANELLNQSTSNSSEYLNLLKKSNIFKFLYLINRETSGYRPSIALMRSVIRDIYKQIETENVETKTNNSNDINDTDYNVSLTELSSSERLQQLESKGKELNEEINKWAQSSHYELQSRVMPFFDKVFVYKYSKLHELFLRLDDLDLVMASNIFAPEGVKSNKNSIFSTFFKFSKDKDGKFDKRFKSVNEDFYYGSLRDSIAQLNYLEGKIDTATENLTLTKINNNQANELIDLESPMKKVEEKTINIKLPELLESIQTSMFNNLAKISLPTFMVTSSFFILGYMELNTSIAILIFSIVLALNNISKESIKQVYGFRTWYLNQVRMSIDESKNLLKGKVNSKLGVTKTIINDDFKVIDELAKDLQNLEKIENNLEK